MLKFLTLGVLLLAAPLLRAGTTPLDTDALATLAVQDHGRKKPFTTFAHEMLLTLSGKSTFTDTDGKKLTPEEVVLDLWFKPEGWDQKPLIMLNFLELKRRMNLSEDQKLFTYAQLIDQPALHDLLEQTQKLRQADKADTMSDVQKEAEKLGQRLQLFQNLVGGGGIKVVPNRSAADAAWNFLLETRDGNFVSYSIVVETGEDSAAPNAAGEKITAWSQQYAADNISKFNSLTPQVVDSLRAIAPQYYPSADTLRFEHNYMTQEPFLWSWVFYLLALIVLLLTALWMTQAGYLATWALVLIGLGLEVYGLVCRILISGRPPVTNLYETVVWVSFCAMVFAVLLEAIYRKRYFFYAGLPASIITLIVADSQPTILDPSINPLTAVLRDNMWLTIHVLTIVSSYAAFLLTAALGHIALVLNFWGRKYAKAQSDLQFFIYRAMQIGVLLLATGTILGGVWANYSWGRFWGWDPKETWALITLLCYLVLLHGRLAGFWSGFGLAVGSVVCFLSVMMSWYGVNFILGQNGRSLHSYGLSSGGFSAAVIFALVEIVFIAVVLLWHRRQKAVAASSAKSTRREPVAQKA